MYHFGHVGQGAAVVEVEVRYDDAVDVARECVTTDDFVVLLLRDVTEVGKPALVLWESTFEGFFNRYNLALNSCGHWLYYYICL